MTPRGIDASESFGELLRGYRLAAGLSQEALAELAGLSAHGIFELERGVRTRPYPATRQRLGAALGLTDAGLAALQASVRPKATSNGDRFLGPIPRRSR